MADLTDDMKLAIVTHLAQFRSPTETVKLVEEDFAVKLERSQVAQYDPTKASFKAGDRWREIFAAIRRTYLEAVGEIPIASQAYRLNFLDRMALRAERSGNMKLAADLLRQAAEEVGGLLTNQRQHRHAVAAPGLQPLATLSLEDMKAELATRLAQAADRAAEKREKKLN
jgi:hypothetical protein